MMELIGGVMDDDAVRGVRAIGNCLVEMHTQSHYKSYFLTLEKMKTASFSQYC